MNIEDIGKMIALFPLFAMIFGLFIVIGLGIVAFTIFTVIEGFLWFFPSFRTPCFGCATCGHESPIAKWNIEDGMDKCPICGAHGNVPDERVYTTGERSLDHLLDCSTMRLEAANHWESMAKSLLEKLDVLEKQP